MNLRFNIFSFGTFHLVALLCVINLALATLFGQTSEPVNSEPKLISSPTFVLSAEAEAAGIDGTLLLAVSIDATGSVTSATVIAGPEWPCGKRPKDQIEDVRKQVSTLVRQAKFSPAIRKGSPVSTEVGINYAIGRAYKELLRDRELEAAKKAGTAKPIDGGVLNGKALSLPKPAYPASARARRASGTVTISILIDETGKVVSAGAKNGQVLLQDAARDSACKARFTPTILNGDPVKVSGVITYTFVAP